MFYSPSLYDRWKLATPPRIEFCEDCREDVSDCVCEKFEWFDCQVCAHPVGFENCTSDATCSKCGAEYLNEEIERICELGESYLRPR